MRLLNNAVHHFILGLAFIIVKLFFPFKVEGRKNLPKRGPYMLYANHLSGWDPIILAVMLAPRKGYFMAKKELFESKIMGWFFDCLGAFPVNRDNADITAVKTSIQHIQNDDIMIIFPEGTRNPEKDGKVKEFRNGVGIIALKTKCDVVPVYIDCIGGYHLFKRFKIKINKSFNVKDCAKKGLHRENLNSCVAQMKKAMIELM